MTSIQLRMDNWFLRNVTALKTTMRVIFGIVWLIDGVLKFQPGLPDQFVAMIGTVMQGQPAWLAGWFNFWMNAVMPDPAFWVYLTGALEVALGLALVLGFVRKVAYLGGIALSLFIWAVPEGFGGPYGPGSTDIGTGVIYAFVFVFLAIINAVFGPSRISLDYLIEKRWNGWKKVAEIRSQAPASVTTAGPTS